MLNCYKKLLSRVTASCVRRRYGVSNCEAAKTTPTSNPEATSNSGTEGHEAELGKMVGNFLTSFSSREQRFSYATDTMFPFTREHYVRAWELENTRTFYDVLHFESLFSDSKELLSLLKVCSSKDPLAKSILHRLQYEDIDLADVDFATTISLCRTCIEQSPPSGVNPDLFYASLRSKLLSKIAGDNPDLDGEELSKALGVLLDARYFSQEMAEKVAVYLSRNFNKLEPKHASAIAVCMAFTRHLNRTRDAHFFNSANDYVLKLLKEGVMKFENVQERVRNQGDKYGYHLGGFMIMYPTTGVYNREICDALAELFLGPFDEQIHFPKFVCRLATMCGQLRYYNKELLDRIIDVSLNQLESFSFDDLGFILRALCLLNHDHQQFLSEVTSHVLKSHSGERNFDVFWSLVNSSVFMNTYDTEMLEVFLTDKMMETSIQERIFHASTLLKFLTGLAVENPHLGLTRTNSVEFGTLPYHFTTLSDNYILLALSNILSMYKKKRYTMFSANFSRALKTAVGTGCFRVEPISLSGYNLDFEVLIGADGKPIPIPFNWKHVHPANALKSIGIAGVAHTFKRMGESKMATLLNDLKQPDETRSDSPLGSACRIERGNGIHLASDWGRYFVKSHHMPCVARRVAFELNGPLHYAVNVPGHIKGKDVVKKRQLEALGWEVVHVPYYEWHKLRTGDDQIRFVTEKLSGEDCTQTVCHPSSHVSEF